MNNDVYVCQYDLLDFDLVLTDESGSPYELDPGEKLWMRVKVCPESEALISVEQTDTHFSFFEIPLAPFTYLLELGITFLNGKEFTIIQSHLIVKPRLKAQ